MAKHFTPHQLDSLANAEQPSALFAWKRFDQVIFGNGHAFPPSHRLHASAGADTVD
jgi:hypothetical protein